jgi:hypothetical protein
VAQQYFHAISLAASLLKPWLLSRKFAQADGIVPSSILIELEAGVFSDPGGDDNTRSNRI